MTAQLYAARDFVRRVLTPDEYRQRIAEYQVHIAVEAAKWGLDNLGAMIRLAKECKYPITQAGLMAAYVELIEPSNP